jgi:hypothetical protein
MAIAGAWNFANGTVPPTPGAGIETLYFDTADGRPKFIGSDGIIHSLDMVQQASSIANSAAINTTSTIISSNGIRMSANQLTAGTIIRCNIFGTNTSSAANNSTFTLYYGPNGTTADTAIATFVLASATSGSNVPFRLFLFATVRTIGAGGTLYGYGDLDNNGTTGIYTLNNLVQALSGALAINTTAVGYLSLGYVSAATTTTTTFNNVSLEVVKQ